MVPAAERALRDGHPWIFASSIREVSREGRTGEIAVLFDRKNRFLAAGLWDARGPIRVRALVVGKGAPIGLDLFRERVEAALHLRRPLFRQPRPTDPATTGFRVLHGESDGMGGVILDAYGAYLVLKLYTPAWLPHLPALLDGIEEGWASAGPTGSPPEGILLLPSRRVEGELPAGLELPAAGRGEIPRTLPFLEHGLRYEAHPLEGHKTGFYLDQRHNRARLARLDWSSLPGGGAEERRRVLNVFSYTGGFSLAAAAGGAREVTSLDLSGAALAQAHRHFELNQDHPEVGKATHQGLEGDAFALLADLGARGARYEVVVVDPPAFAKEAGQVPGALAQYGRLTRLALGVLVPGGLLVQASCSSRITPEALEGAVFRAATEAGRPLRLVERTEHDVDHPVRIPENAYLKAVWARG